MPISSSQPRVLQIIKGLDIGGLNGGSDRFGADLAYSLKNCGWQVSLCVFFKTMTQQEAVYLRRLESAGMDVFFASDFIGKITLGSYLKGLSVLSKRLRAHPMDICHSHFQPGTLLAIYLKFLRLTKKAVRTAHGMIEWQSNYSGKLQRFLFSGWIYPLFLDAEVGVSQAVVDGLRHNPGLRISRREPWLIYNAISIDPDHSSLPQMKDRKMTDPIIGTVGRLTEQKGQIFLLKAIPAILNRFPTAQFWIVGDGNLRSRLESLAQESGITNSVRFLGHRSDVPELIKQMDLFVLSSSVAEGLPTVIIESMACGVPVIGTDIPGTREIIQDQINGWLIPAQDPGSLANAIISCLESPEMAARFAENALKTLDRFSMKTISNAYARLYEKLLEG